MNEYKILEINQFGNLSLELNYYNTKYTCRLDNKASNDYIELFILNDEAKAREFYNKLVEFYTDLGKYKGA